MGVSWSRVGAKKRMEIISKAIGSNFLGQLKRILLKCLEFSSRYKFVQKLIDKDTGLTFKEDMNDMAWSDTSWWLLSILRTKMFLQYRFGPDENVEYVLWPTTISYKKTSTDVADSRPQGCRPDLFSTDPSSIFGHYVPRPRLSDVLRKPNKLIVSVIINLFLTV